MDEKQSFFAAALAMSALDDVPTPNKYAKNIVALLKERSRVLDNQNSDRQTAKWKELLWYIR